MQLLFENNYKSMEIATRGLANTLVKSKLQ
jgi:hypothetical protein